MDFLTAITHQYQTNRPQSPTPAPAPVNQQLLVLGQSKDLETSPIDVTSSTDVKKEDQGTMGGETASGKGSGRGVNRHGQFAAPSEKRETIGLLK